MADSNVLREDVVRIKYETDLSSLNQVGVEIDSIIQTFAQLGTSSQVAENTINQLGNSAQTVENNIEQLGGSSEETESSIEQLGEAAEEAENNIEQLGETTEELGHNSDGSGDSAGKLREQLMKLGEVSLKKLDNALDSVAKKLGSAVVSGAKAALNALRNFAVAGAAAVGGLIAIGVHYNSTMEQYQTSFETMLGSADKATEFTEKLRQMAAATPFGMNDLAQVSQTLLGFGIAEKEVLPYLKQIGDISQGNAEKFNSLALAFAQVQSAGKLQDQDLMQMINQGFNPLKNIAERTGKSIGQLKDEMSKGGVTAEMVAQAFEDATSEGGIFYNAMEKQSKTFNGQISTLKDNWMAFVGEMTKGVQDLLKNTALPMINEQLDKFKNAFEEFGFRGILREFGRVGHYAELLGDIFHHSFNDPEKMKIFNDIGEDLAGTFHKLVDFIGEGASAFAEWVTSKDTLESLRDGFDKLTDALDWTIDNWDKVVETGKTALITFATISGAVKMLSGVFTLLNFAASPAGQVVIETLGIMGSAIASFASSAISLLAPIAPAILAVGGAVAMVVWDIVDWEGAKKFWTDFWLERWDALQTIGDAMCDGLNYIAEFWKNTWSGLGDWANNVFKSIGEGWDNLAANLQNGLNAISQAANDPVGNWVTGAKSLGWMHADGGLMTSPHIGMVAEAGPEMIIPLSADKRNSAVGMWESTGRMLGVHNSSSSSISYAPNVNITVTADTSRGTIRQIETAVKEALEESFASALRRRPRETYV